MRRERDPSCFDPQKCLGAGMNQIADSNRPQAVDAQIKTETDRRNLRTLSLVADGAVNRWGDVLKSKDRSCS